MSIAYFPEIYPDELFYSVLARYFVHSGHTSNLSCFNEIYNSGNLRPDIEFMNQIVPEIRQQFEKQMPWEQVIKKHTMYPYYSRFADGNRREEAWESMLNMGKGESAIQPKFSRILSISQGREEDYCLRYCPICVKEDRKLYGETYWHRRHQIRGLNICCVHGCRLYESGISLMSYNWSHVLRCAEHEIGEPSDGELAYMAGWKEFAGYVVEVLEQDSYKGYGETVAMLYSKAKDIYRYGRQKAISITALNAEFQEWKRKNMLGGRLLETWQVKKLLRGYRRIEVEVCQMAYFLKAGVKEMADPVVVEMRGSADFENRARSLLDEGKRMKDIAKELGISASTLLEFCNENGIHMDSKYRKTEKIKQKIVEERRYWLKLKEENPDMSYNALCQIKEHRGHLNFLRKYDKAWTDEHWFQGCKKRGEAKDWKKFDEDTLPQVKNAIASMTEGKPQAICLYSVAKRIGISSMTIKTHLPKCREEIKRNEMTQNELYARKMLWAVNKIQSEGGCPSWNQVRLLTRIEKGDAIASLPSMEEIAEPELYGLVQALL